MFLLCVCVWLNLTLTGRSAVQTGALTAAGWDSRSLRGVNEARGGKVAEEEEEASEVVAEEVETDPSSLQRSWTPSWMRTMPRCVLP